MAIFYTDTGSLGQLEISGSGNILNLKGSGSNILVISGSAGSLLEISDLSPGSNLFTVASGSTDILTINSAKTVSISGSLVLTGSFISTTELQVTASQAVSASFANNVSNNIKTARFELGVSSTTAITTGAKGRKTVPYTGTIVGWKLVVDQSTTTTVDIWKANNAIPTNADSITGTAKPSLTAAQLNSSTTLTGWTTSVSSGDVFILEVESNDNANYLSLELDILLS